MINNTESYIDKPYLSKYPSIVTSRDGCAVLSYGNVNSYHSEKFNDIDMRYGYDQDFSYDTQPPTWAPLDNIICADFENDAEVIFDALTSLDIINKLAFIAVDEEADRRIEEYFASNPIKTRTIFENHRMKKG
uniref:hypothetical protein n=1 Tax=Candidatus Electrothrix sp. TaxID=2170559 RepID=UPI004055C287